MLVSVEVPVLHHYFLEETIQSVLKQTYPNWVLILLSDGATDEACDLMARYRYKFPDKIITHYQSNQGIFHSRRRLTNLSMSDLIIPLDHDDILYPNALEKMVECFKHDERIGLVRARRNFIDEQSQNVEQSDWFPFAERTITNGMTSDIFNHSQPYMFKRNVYERTSGWNGFEEFQGAGGDCDIFLKLEECSKIYLLDDVLYGYRLNEKRTSHDIGLEGAKKMWGMLADQTIQRRGLSLKRINDMPPFVFEEVG